MTKAKVEAQLEALKRSDVARAELAEQGYQSYWSVANRETVVEYYTNGLGKAVLLVRHVETGSWDLYQPLTNSNKIADTLQSLSDYTKEVPR